MDAVLDAVDLSGIATWASAAMILVIGISLAFKGGVLGKRAVAKA